MSSISWLYSFTISLFHIIHIFQVIHNTKNDRTSSEQNCPVVSSSDHQAKLFSNDIMLNHSHFKRIYFGRFVNLLINKVQKWKILVRFRKKMAKCEQTQNEYWIDDERNIKHENCNVWSGFFTISSCKLVFFVIASRSSAYSASMPLWRKKSHLKKRKVFNRKMVKSWCTFK